MSTPFYDLASLVLVPSGYKASKVYAQKPLTTDGQLAFSRASTATRVNASGLIETVSSNVPRLDYLNSSCPRLLLEPQRSNVLTFSEQIDNAAWGKTNVSVTANNTASPDGYTNADKVVANTTNGVHRIEQDRATAAQVATQSIFAKASGYNFIALENGGEIAYFNISTGVVGTVSGGTASIQNYGNGWYRCIFTATALNTKSYIYISNANNVISFAGDNTSGAFLYGAQFEAGAYATSYIPTLGTSVTRVADAASKTGISSLIGQTEGTLYSEFVVNGFADFGTPLCVNNGTTNESIWLTTFANGDIRAEVFSNAGGGVQATFTKSGNVVGQTYKIALGYAANNFAFFVNGVQVGTTDTSGAVPVGMNRVDFDYTSTSSFVQSAIAIKQALLFKTRLTNAQLAELTTL
jgi:hypothetical protein